MRTLFRRARTASRSAFVIAGACSAITVAAAQGTPVRHIGGAAAGAAGLIQAQTICTPSAVVCPPPILGAPPLPNAGGTAYDPSSQTIWNTDGVSVLAVSSGTFSPPCVVKCPPTPWAALGIPAPLLVTGLAFDNNAGNLLAVDNGVPANVYVFGITAAGCPGLRLRCPLPAALFPAGWATSGLAFSETLNLVFVLADNFAGGPGPLVATVAIGAAGCGPRCPVTRVLPCTTIPLRHLRGAAFDDCTSELCFTDGTVLLHNTFAPATCVLGNPRCCITPVAAAVYYGLDIEASHAVRRGVSCTAAPCPACPALSLTARGDPAIGNASFTLDVMNAPAPGTVAVGLVGLGPCTPGLPLLCGFYYPIIPPAPIFLPGVPIAGLGPCGGTAAIALPIPLNPGLCSVNLCAQAAVVCVAGGVFGIGLTNGLDLTISDS